MQKTNLKVLFWDIETSPNLAYVWGRYQQDVIDYEREWSTLCFSAKWLGQKRIHTYALPDYDRYKQNEHDDSVLIKELWKFLDESDVAIAHNGDRFDIRKSNAKFLLHGLKPPSPYISIDTLKHSRRLFKLESHRLNDIGRYLGVGEKAETGGFSLWKGCIRGEKKAWDKMKKYSKQDVALLENVYYAMRPWMNNHPNFNVLDRRTMACPTCQSTDVQKRGFSFTRTGKKQQYQCKKCGAWSSGAIERVKEIEIR